jgi:hypothetical protein
VTYAGLSDEMWRFSTSKIGWERVDNLFGDTPSARAGYSMTSVGMDLWLLGGNTDSVFAEMWLFSTSTRGWERVGNTMTNGARPSARTGHVMTSVGLDLWVYGGETNSGEDHTDSVSVTLLLLLVRERVCLFTPFTLLCDLLPFKKFSWSKLPGYTTYYTISLIRAAGPTVRESGVRVTLWSPPG